MAVPLVWQRAPTLRAVQGDLVRHTAGSSAVHASSSDQIATKPAALDTALSRTAAFCSQSLHSHHAEFHGSHSARRACPHFLGDHICAAFTPRLCASARCSGAGATGAGCSLSSRRRRCGGLNSGGGGGGSRCRCRQSAGGCASSSAGSYLPVTLLVTPHYSPESHLSLNCTGHGSMPLCIEASAGSLNGEQPKCCHFRAQTANGRLAHAMKEGNWLHSDKCRCHVVPQRHLCIQSP